MSDDESLTDDEWINEFEDDEEKFGEFYNEPVDYINIYFLYLKNKEILYRKNIKYYLRKANILSSEELIGLIVKFKRKDEKIYSILKNSIDTHYENINKFIQSNEDTMKEIKSFESIEFDNTIPVFKELNNIFIFICNKEKKNNTSRKNKIVIESNIQNNLKEVPKEEPKEEQKVKENKDTKKIKITLTNENKKTKKNTNDIMKNLIKKH